MARKPEAEWTAAYRRRIERARAKAEASGVKFSKALARGHTLRESAERRERKTARLLGTSTLTGSQRGQITRYWNNISPRYRTQVNRDKLDQMIEAKGFGWFKELLAIKKDLEKNAHKRPRGSGILEAGLHILGVEPEDDMDWLLFYF